MTRAGRTAAASPRSEQGATQGHPGAPVASQLRHIAALHADQARVQEALASAYDDLARDVEIGLAAFANQSVHALVREQEEEHRLLTQSEVAKRLGCSPRTVRRLELEGAIPAATGTGQRKRWRSSDIDRIVEADEL